MNNFKFTGTNIAAALLIIAYFFTWVSFPIPMSGFSLTSNGISPGMLAFFITGLTRFFMVLAILIPLCSALILYQNITANKKFDKYYKPAHIIPCVYLILGIIMLYFKMKPETTAASDNPFGEMVSRSVRDMTPGAFDTLSFGFYVCLAAAIYLLLVGIGKVKDKEYYKATVASPDNKPISKPE
jgi:hypothetical protein